MSFRYLAACCFLLLQLACCLPTHAGFSILRDSIFDPNDPNNPTSWTDGNPGGSTIHAGADWHTPGYVIDVAETGVLSEAQIVIFARDQDALPENNIANIAGYPMDFHVWFDGINGGPDSFNDNAVALSVGDHIDVSVNSSTESFITVEEFGITGPPGDPSMFTTFLVTMDLSSFAIHSEAGQQHVVGVIQSGSNFVSGGGFFRVIGSQSFGFEDVYQQFDTPLALRPGFLASQHLNPFEQYSARVTLGNGDFDGDDDVDGMDFLFWQQNLGQSVTPDQDGNGDGILDGKDLAIWEATFGTSWSAPLSASATVPEPSGLILSLVGLLFLLNHKGHKEHKGRRRLLALCPFVFFVVSFLGMAGSSHAGFGEPNGEPNGTGLISPF